MRAAKCWVGLWVVVACAGGALAACSSSDTSAGGDSGVDSSPGSDGTMNDGPASEAGVEAAAKESGGDAPVDACIVADASIETVNAGALWGCYQSACSTELTGCAADCICNDAMLRALLCAAAGGDAATCFGNEIQSNGTDRNVILVASCLRNGAGAACAGGGDAGADSGGGSNGGGDAATEGGREAGTPDGGADGDGGPGADAASDGG